VTSEPVLLRMQGIAKRFGGAVALESVDLEVRAGELHALVGENGAGKSTLMKILSGAVVADAGTMALSGARYAPRSPEDALRAGVAMIYQELNLAPDLTVAQNLTLGREAHRFGVLTPRAEKKAIDDVLAVLAHPDLRGDAIVRTLGPGPRQLVEIGRALLGNARLVVLDEPTSSLSAAEAATLDTVLARLRERGVAIVYITHFLEEVMRLAEGFTVLRDGRTVSTGLVAETTTAAIVEAMVGRPLDEIYPRVAHQPGEILLEVKSLAGARLPQSVTLTLRRGEVLGLAGLVGAGRTELLRALYGLDPVRSGTVKIAGSVDGGRGVIGRIAQKVGLLSEDRKAEGIALARPIADNVTLSREVSRFGVLDAKRRDEAVRALLKQLGVKATGPSQLAGDLSGGNQQKLALARLLHQDADVLLLDEPTRGIDVRSKSEIYRRIGELAASGKAILVVSSYLPELLGVCDRIAVMHRGVLGAARDASDWSQATLFEEALGRRDGAGAAA
jgi:ribose transport system ATP-binding protein